MPHTETLPETTLQLNRTFTAPRARVFKAWTKTEELKKWFAPSDEYSVPFAEVDLQVGGKYRIGMKSPSGDTHIAVGTYREIKNPEKLVFTWTWEGTEMPDTLVTVEFYDRGQSTEMVLTHELFPNKTEADRHDQGWTGCLDRLTKIL